MTRIAIRVSRAHVLANGAELANLFAGKRTLQVISTSTDDDDFLVREDTCESDSTRLLFVGFVRPEKGLEYLIRALPLIETKAVLAVVGSADQFAGKQNPLQNLADELGVADRVSWEGYAKFGPELFGQMDRSDILVLPSLSEGTPRVLVEARARSLPIVATNVGGIPSSVTDGEDGLLVPPRDPAALAGAISRIITDRPLRQTLIANGRNKVRCWTVGRFVDLVLERLETLKTPASEKDQADEAVVADDGSG